MGKIGPYIGLSLDCTGKDDHIPHHTFNNDGFEGNM